MAYFPFSGWGNSFFGVLHGPGAAMRSQESLHG